jgi:hypothetical protein
MRLSVHRVAAVIVIGLVAGSYNHHRYMTWNRRGKDAFIAYQLGKFDKYMAHPHSLMFTLATNVIAWALILGFYELIVAVLSKLFPPQPTVIPSDANRA